MARIDAAMMIAADPEVVGCALGEGSALLNLRSNIYYSLNEVGAFAWNAMSVPIGFGQLVQDISAAFGAPTAQVEEDLARLLSQMDAAGLVTCSRP